MTVMKTNMEYCSVAAIRYAKVLLALEIKEETIADTAGIIGEVPELLSVLGSPVITDKEKHAVIDRTFPGDITKFLKVVTDHGKTDKLPEIFRAYEQLRKKQHKVAAARLSYVTPPSKEQLEGMEQFICKKFSVEDVAWEMIEAPELMGGFILRVDGVEYDYSMQGSLNRLEQKLTWR